MNIFQPRRGSVDPELNQNYISNLPTDVKEEVLSKLPIKEAVRTSLLSTKWKNAWMSIPNLMFKEERSLSKLIKLVDLVLLLHRGPILQFELLTSYRQVCNEAIDRWMLILSRNGIKNLYINLHSPRKSMIPSSFFFCLALEHVHISRSTICVPPSFLGFKFLRTLRLFRCKLTGTVARFISNCPLLESLELSDINVFGCLVIRAPNLRWLSIVGHFDDLCLETPKLRFADINLEDNLEYYLNLRLPCKDCECRILQVLGSLSAIEQLKLRIYFFTYLIKGPIPEVLPASFCHLTELHIDIFSTCKEQVALAFCLFKNAPNLKVLVLELDEVESYPSSSLAQSFWEVKGIESNLFNCLEIVKINFLCPESILNVAKFVLSTAPVLDKLVISERDIHNLMYHLAFLKKQAIRKGNNYDLMDGMAFLKKLVSLPRLSKMAKIVFVE